MLVLNLSSVDTSSLALPHTYFRHILDGETIGQHHGLVVHLMGLTQFRGHGIPFLFQYRIICYRKTLVHFQVLL